MTICDAFGYSAMHYACMGGNKACFIALANRADDFDLEVDSISHSGITCLMSALDSRSAETVACVLEQSANPFLKDCFGFDALAYANKMKDNIGQELAR